MRCKICNHKITDPTSTKFSIGPECWKKYPELAKMLSEEEIDNFLFSKGIQIDHMPTPEQAKSKFAKFANRPFRKNQEETIDFAMHSKNRFRIIEASTGSGKSLLGMTCGVMAGKANYLCSTKLLQAQIISDFPEAKSLWGRGNYPCMTNTMKSCDECSATDENPCEYSCPYKMEKAKVLASSLRILNYSYYLTEIAFAGKFSGSPLTIIDEADALEGTLINHISLSFTERSLYRLGLQNGPKLKTVTAKNGLQSWKDFGNEALIRSRSIFSKLDDEIDNFRKITEDWQHEKIKERDYFKHLWERCLIFVNNVDKDWIMEETPRQGSRQGVTIFRPLWITPELAEKFLWRHSDNWILMSASFLPLPVLCKTLGIDHAEVDYMAIPSTFPIENRPINMWPVCSLTAKTMEEETPKLISGIKKVLKRHPGEKGLIHCVSFKLGKTIVEQVNNPRLIIHTSADRQEVIDNFTSTDKDDSVLVSPSSERGLSLNDSLCRFVAIAKAPFLSLGDRVVSARVFGSGEIGKLWYAAQMMLSVLQMCGRGVRSIDDYCTCYVLDDQVNRVYTSKPSLWPEWFKDAITWGENELLLERNDDDVYEMVQVKEFSELDDVPF